MVWKLLLGSGIQLSRAVCNSVHLGAVSFKKRQKSHLNDILSCQVQQPGYGDHGKNNEKDLKLGSLQAIDHKTFFYMQSFQIVNISWAIWYHHVCLYPRGGEGRVKVKGLFQRGNDLETHEMSSWFSPQKPASRNYGAMVLREQVLGVSIMRTMPISKSSWLLL